MSTVFRSRRVAPVAAVAFGALTLGLGLMTVPLDVLTNAVAHQVGPGGPVADWVTTVALMAPPVAVATLLAVRRPRNPIGWVLLAIFFVAFAPFSGYAVLDYRMHRGTLPLGWVAVVLGEAWPIFLLLIAVLVWLFPDGRLPAERWRRVAVALLGAGVVLGLAASASGVAAVTGHDIRINANGSLTTYQAGVWNILHSALVLGVCASWLAWLVVQVPRYRHATGERRQQLKWLYSGGAVFVVSVFCAALVSGSISGLARLVSNLISPLGYVAFVACIAVAVLRYRLYEIDRIISRTLAYAIVTGLLVGLYAGLVLLATHVLSLHTPVAVASATLAAAALFSPLRRRVQQVVDRRFNRARYDADRTVAAFAARLKDAVDLDSVRDDLAGVVNRVLEPAHVSVWISRRD
ncbi:MAG TPA: hypothetical protein VEF71_13060 [Streptosporangiaceae bacterium]|nr:hypothetical protein [Streptosporangiaceae bacterium]